MHNRQFKALVAVNLRLLNPQVTDRYRLRGATGPALTRKLTYQFYLNAFIFIVFYTGSLLGANLSQLPGTFTFYVGLFILLGLSQSISGIYNVFFAGKDLAAYLPLPLNAKAIFLSKGLIVALSVVSFTLPLAIIFTFTALSAHVFFGLALFMALVVYGLLLTVIFTFCSLLVFGLTKTRVFQAHQSLAMNVLTWGTMVVAVAGIFLIDNHSGSTVDRPAISLLLPLFKLFAAPLAGENLLTWGGLIGLLALLWGLTDRYVLRHLTDQLTRVNTIAGTHSAHKHRERQGLRPILRTYNYQLLKEPNLLLQVFTNSVMTPLIFIVAFTFAGTATNLSHLSTNWWGVLLVSGIAFSTVTVNASSLISSLISLDRLNFAFISALPIPMRQYLRQKFRLGYLIQVVVNWGMAAVLMISYQLSPFLDLSFLIGIAWGTYLMCQLYFRRDYRLRTANWINVTQLFSRGGGNLAMMVSLFVNLISSAIVITLYSAAVYWLPDTLVLNGTVFVVLCVVSGIIMRHYWLTFWRTLSV